MSWYHTSCGGLSDLSQKIAGFDTSVHISEEAKNAPRAVPFAIMSATIVSATLGWRELVPMIYHSDSDNKMRTVVNIVLAFYMGNDLASVTGNAIGQPMATVRPKPLVLPANC